MGDSHATLGWLEAERGRREEASKELAIALDPSGAGPHVSLGVIAARAGPYDEVLKNFKTATSLDPAYENLDRLVEEASKGARKSY